MIDLDLSIARPNFTVQAQIALPARGITAVIGRSGSGKSTLLHAMAGLLTPARGRFERRVAACSTATMAPTCLRTSALSASCFKKAGSFRT